MYASSQQYGEGHSPEPDASKAKRETRDNWIQKRSGEKATSHSGDCEMLFGDACRLVSGQ